MIAPLAFAFLASTGLAALILLTRGVHLHFTGSDRHEGPQHMQLQRLPRVGGLAIFMGFFIAVGVARLFGYISAPTQSMANTLGLCSLPVVIAGLLEDLSNRVRPLWRMLAAFVAAMLAVYLLGANIQSLHLALFDQWLFQYGWLSCAITLLSIAGLVHAMNIIDGLNGLLAGVCLLIFAALGWAANRAGDTALTSICVLCFGVTAGFFGFNFPKAKLISGDGGAYFLGFMIALLSVLLVQRNPGISPWFPLLLASYPITETLFSIIRRFIKGSKISGADNQHLHSLMAFSLKEKHRAGHRVLLGFNAGASIRCMGLALFGTFSAWVFVDNVPMLQWMCLGFVLLYLLIFYNEIKKQMLDHSSETNESGSTTPS